MVILIIARKVKEAQPSTLWGATRRLSCQLVQDMTLQIRYVDDLSNINGVYSIERASIPSSFRVFVSKTIVSLFFVCQKTVDDQSAFSVCSSWWILYWSIIRYWMGERIPSNLRFLIHFQTVNNRCYFPSQFHHEAKNHSETQYCLPYLTSSFSFHTNGIESKSPPKFAISVALSFNPTTGNSLPITLSNPFSIRKNNH